MRLVIVTHKQMEEKVSKTSTCALVLQACLVYSWRIANYGMKKLLSQKNNYENLLFK